MKKTVYSIFSIMLVLALLSACSTLKSSQNSYSTSQKDAPLFELKLDSVVLIIDHVNETDGAEQIYNMIQTNLEKQYSYTIPFDGQARLSVEIIQRSFMSGIDMLNSIYIAFSVCDENGNLIAKENQFLTGRMTMLAAVDQYKYVSKLLKKIIAIQEKQYDKRETELRKQK